MKTVIASVVTLLFVGSIARADVSECNLDSMMPAIQASVAKYLTNIMSGKRIEFDATSMAIKYTGQSDVTDDILMPGKSKAQNLFEVTLMTRKGSKLSLVTAAYGLCEGKAQMCYFVPDQNIFALPAPKIEVTRNAEGIVTARHCVVKSHDGYNRYALVINRAEDFIVSDELISYVYPVISSQPMK